jgi:hypothetical protein
VSGNSSKEGAGCLLRELLCPGGYLLCRQFPSRSFLSWPPQLGAPVPVCKASDLDPCTAVGALSLRFQNLVPGRSGARHLY